MKNNKPWYSIFSGRYMGQEAPFYNREDLPWTKVLEDNWEMIRDEVITLIEVQPARLKPYFINKSMSFPPRKWKTMGLYFWKFRMHNNCKRCPKTVRLMKQIPNLTSCSLSVLEPGSNINPHQGDTNAVIRCHLGLSVPASLPECGFQVGKEIRSWENGKALPFCDAQTHMAWNNSKERRLILIIDVMREEFANAQNTVCAHVLASAALQMLYQHFAFLGRRSGYFKNALYKLLIAFIRIILPIQRLSLLK
jgi:aspartyl/asparaginyl beta-hydroxylase (cupin superfamily)